MPFNRAWGEKKETVTGRSCVPQAVLVSASCPSVTGHGAPVVTWTSDPGCSKGQASAKALRRERKPEGQREESGAEGDRGRSGPREAAPGRAFTRKEMRAAEGSVQRRPGPGWRPRWDRCPRLLYREQTAGAAAAGESQGGAAGAPGWVAGPRRWSSPGVPLKEELPGGSC